MTFSLILFFISVDVHANIMEPVLSRTFPVYIQVETVLSIFIELEYLNQLFAFFHTTNHPAVLTHREKDTFYEYCLMYFVDHGLGIVTFRKEETDFVFHFPRTRIQTGFHKESLAKAG